MSVQAQVEPLNGTLPGVSWQWDPETDILSGGFKGSRKAGGYTGTIELTDDVGSIAVLDVASGVICGLDVVVWPDVRTVPDLRAPAHLTDGRVVVVQRAGESIESLEVDTSLAVDASPDESTFHFCIGTPRPVEVVRVADRLSIEVDHDGRLAGLWLTGVPPFPDLEDEAL